MKKLIQIMAGSAAALLFCGGAFSFEYTPPAGADSASISGKSLNPMCQIVKAKVSEAFMDSLMNPDNGIQTFTDQTGYTASSRDNTKILNYLKDALADQPTSCVSGTTQAASVPGTDVSATSGSLTGCGAGKALWVGTVGTGCNPGAIDGTKYILCQVPNATDPGEPGLGLALHVQISGSTNPDKIGAYLKKHCDPKIEVLTGFSSS